MSGTVTLSLQTLFDKVTHDVLAGGKMYFYGAGTTTPQSAYRDSALVSAYTNPLILEADGFVPNLWFADGQVHVVVTNAAGQLQFDADFVQVFATSGGTPPPPSVDPTLLATTGDLKFRGTAASLTGWVLANGRTIGDATSGAASSGAGYQALFQYLWNNFADTICPVTGGRGANADADWNAHKQIATLDMRGRTAAGTDDMGGAAAGRITSATIANPTTGGAAGGAQQHTLTVAQMPTITPTGTLATAGAHTHGYGSPTSNNTQGGGNVMRVPTPDNSQTTTSNGDHTHAFTGDPVGGGGAHNNVQPTMLGAWFIKL